MTRLQVLLGVLVIVILVAFGAYYVNYMQAPAPQTSTATTTNQQATIPPQALPAINASKYIAENIAKISGMTVSSSTKLLVSKINFGNGTGTVEFGDGKKTYTADFNFSATGTSTSVTNFKLRK